MITAVEIYGQAELDRLCESRDFPRGAPISIVNPHWIFRKPSRDEATPKSIKGKFGDILRLGYFDEVEFEKIPKGRPIRLPHEGILGMADELAGWFPRRGGAGAGKPGESGGGEARK